MKEEESVERIARRAALELKEGYAVNLGVGMPVEVVKYIPQGIQFFLQSENGILGMGERAEKGKEKEDMIDASRNYVTVKPYGSFFDSCTSFGMIRGGYIDLTILGALQVDEEGNLANWNIPGRLGPGIGGGMDLVVGAKRVVIATFHTLKDGKPKIVKKCTLSLTAPAQVNRIITEMAVIDVCYEGPDKGLILKEVAEGHTVEDVVKATEAKLNIGKIEPWQTEYRD